ncbi:MAG: DUF6089 family protein [Saprospiraceae bacterium]
MKKFLLFILFSILMLVSPTESSCQYTEFGIGLGATTYWGDLNGPSFSKNLTKNSGLGVQLSYRKLFGNYVGGRASFVFGSFKGDDANSTLDWQQLRNLNFKSNLVELAVMGELYIFGMDTEPGGSVFSPYLTAGIAGFHFDPKTVYRGTEVRLQPLGTEGQGMPGFGQKYGLNGFSIPFGGGAKIILSENLNIGLEVVMRRSFTDYVDDLSSVYVNYDDLNAGNGTLAANLGNRMNEFLGQTEPVQLPTGSQRGGALVKDYYIVSMVTLNFTLNSSNGKKKFGNGNKIICPKF